MNRRIRAPLFALFGFAIAGCGGAGTSSLPPAAAPTSAVASPPSAGTPVGTARISLSFGLGTTSSTAARQTRSYVSPKTKSVGVYVTSVNGTAPVPAIPAIVADVGSGATNCTTSGSTITCNLAVSLPTGSVVLNVRTFPTAAAQGPPLSIGSVGVSILANQAVDAPIVFSPVVAVAITSLSSTSIPGNQPGTVTLSVSAKDYAGDTIVGTDPYYRPIVISTSDTSGHVTAAPALPASITAPGQSITLNYDGKGAASFFAYTSAVAPDTVVNGVPPVGGTLTFVQNGEYVYVSSQIANSITAYAAGPAGANTPVRVIAGANTTLAQPVAIAVDKNGALYVVNYQRDVTVFAPGANGNVAPVFTFGGGAGHPESIALISGLQPVTTGPLTAGDPTTTRVQYYNDIYQAAPLGGELIRVGGQAAGIVAFSQSPQNGQFCIQQTPVSSNPATICDNLPVDGSTFGVPQFQSYGLAFRADGLLAVSQLPGFNKPLSSVATYTLPTRSPNYTTYLTATTTLSGPSTQLSQPYQIAFDAAGFMYVANAGQATGDGRVTVFAPNANGDTPPVRVLTGFSVSTGVAVGH